MLRKSAPLRLAHVPGRDHVVRREVHRAVAQHDAVGHPGHTEVADRIQEYHELGFDEFILSGHPHLEEAFWFGEGVMPELRRRGLLDELPRRPGQADSVLGRHAVTNAR